MSSQKNQTASSFSSVVEKSNLPKKNQLIVCNIIDGVKAEEYIYALGDKIGPANILEASRMSNDRFCWTLVNDKMVDDLTQEGKNELKIGKLKVALRPYVSRMKRVTFSNVPGMIPNELLIGRMKEHGVVIPTSLTPIRVGLDRTGYSHIKSWRRQCFINPDDIGKLPASFTVNHEGTLHRIYVTTDKMSCFVCKKEGHSSKHCPETLNSKQKQSQQTGQQNLDACADELEEQQQQQQQLGVTQLTPPQSANPYEDNDSTSNSLPLVINPTLVDTVKQNSLKTNRTTPTFNGQTLFTAPTFNPKKDDDTSKRPISTDGSTVSSVELMEMPTGMQLSQDAAMSFTSPEPSLPVTQKDMKEKKEQDKNNRKAKRTKYTHVTRTEAILTTLQAAHIDVDDSISRTFPVEAENFYNLVIEAHQVKQVEFPRLIRKYTNNYVGLNSEIKAIYDKITNDSSLKNKLTRIRNAIKRMPESSELHFSECEEYMTESESDTKKAERESESEVEDDLISALN